MRAVRRPRPVGAVEHDLADRARCELAPFYSMLEANGFALVSDALCGVLCRGGGRGCRILEDAVAQLLQSGDAALPSEEPLHALAAGVTHSLAQVRVGEQSVDCGGQAIAVTTLDEYAGLTVHHYLW